MSNISKFGATLCVKNDSTSLIKGRFAPSPTGYMHLGNAWSFLIGWLCARKADGALVLRIEDVDPARSKIEYISALIEDLHWLGLDWDEGFDMGGLNAPYSQGESTQYYEKAIDALRKDDLVYPCYCTRKELRSLASAPHRGEDSSAYPQVCLALSEEEREKKEQAGRKPSIRLHGEVGSISFRDSIFGSRCYSWNECGGDFPLQRSDGVYAYQLAVVIDDIRQGITQVVRGEDILHCTPRQIYLYKLLGCQHPQYIHVPLVVDHKNERLAKRHEHFELKEMRQHGITAQAIVGYLAYAGGLLPNLYPIDPQDLLTQFDLNNISTDQIVLPENIFDILLKMSVR